MLRWENNKKNKKTNTRNMILDKKIKIIAYCIEAAIIIILIALAVAVGAKNRTIKAQKSEITNLQEQVDSLKKDVRTLGAMDAITVNATFNVNNKNIFSVNTTQANQVMKTYAELTRKEILDSVLLLKK